MNPKPSTTLAELDDCKNLDELAEKMGTTRRALVVEMLGAVMLAFVLILLGFTLARL
jgi:hypothetical protein